MHNPSDATVTEYAFQTCPVIPITISAIDSPSTIRTNAPKRSGKYDGSGAYCECNFPAVRGVTKSIINATIQNIKRISKTDMKAATTQITIERENPSMNRLIK